MHYKDRPTEPQVGADDSIKAQWRSVGTQMVNMLRLKQLSLQTERTYMTWLRGFYRFVSDTSPYLIDIKKLFEIDRQHNTPGVEMPYALERKYPNAGKECGWQWLFPSSRLSTDPRSKIIRRHHMHCSILHRHLKKAALKSGITKSELQQTHLFGRWSISPAIPQTSARSFFRLR